MMVIIVDSIHDNLRHGARPFVLSEFNTFHQFGNLTFVQLKIAGHFTAKTQVLAKRKNTKLKNHKKIINLRHAHALCAAQLLSAQILLHARRIAVIATGAFQQCGSRLRKIVLKHVNIGERVLKQVRRPLGHRRIAATCPFPRVGRQLFAALTHPCTISIKC